MDSTYVSGRGRIANIFISYRREDSADVTGRIRDRLVQDFGSKSVFIDVDNIPLGVNFADHIDSVVGECEVLLAVIGRDWLSATDENGQRRLDGRTDFVRTEIESALGRKIPVVPLLVRGASMPEADDLPQSIRELALRNGMSVRADPDFHNDCNRLVEGLNKHIAGNKSIETPEPAPPPPGWRKWAGVLVGFAVLAGLAFAGYSYFSVKDPTVATGTTKPARPVEIPKPTAKLSASKSTIERGQRTILTWQSKHATDVRITPQPGVVQSSGTIGVSPDVDTTYTLTAKSEHGSATDSVQIRVQTPTVTRDRDQAFEDASNRNGRPSFHATFDNDTVNSPPRAPEVGTWMNQNTAAGVIAVRSSVGDLTGKPVQLSQRDNVPGGVTLAGKFLAAGRTGIYIASWRALVAEPSPCFVTVAVRDGNPVASIAYRPNGRITTGSNQEAFPVQWTEGVWQLFEVVIDLDNRSVSYMVDGKKIEGFQRVRIAADNPSIQSISMELGCQQRQSFAWDDVKVIRVR